jgi:hypothetical protein
MPWYWYGPRTLVDVAYAMTELLVLGCPKWLHSTGVLVGLAGTTSV